jgi:hypothetical protein
MRRRLAVLSLLTVAFAAIAAAPVAKASPQLGIERDLAANSGQHASYDLDSLASLDIKVPQPAEIRIVRADSAGRKLLVVQVRDLPNPAARQTDETPRAYRSSSRIAFAPSTPGIEASTSSTAQGLSIGSSAVNRHGNQRLNTRLNTGLRAAAAIGTLASTGRFRLRS